MSAMEARRGVHLTGARQCGKTTLARALDFPACRRYSFDEEKIRRPAQDDPLGFVKHAPGETLVIDEVQKVPPILESVKVVLDNDNAKGQYLLTGSSNLNFAKAIKDNLAGRLRTIRLRTLALGEVNGGKGNFLESAFAGDFLRYYGDMDKREVIHQAFLGGYPEARGLSVVERQYWFNDYLNDLLMKDIKDVTEIRKIASLRQVSDWLLAYSSKFFRQEELCREASISKVTATNYLEALGAIYVFDEVAPWTCSDYAKVGKRTKYFAADPGLMANVPRWNEDQVYLDDDRCGKLIETWVYHELASLCDRSGLYRLMHYRDSDKHEIDFLIERNDGALLGIEVKSGTFGSGDFSHLRWFAERLARTSFVGVVLYSGKEVFSMGKNCYAVPLAALGA